jgi:hypothetical protein
MADSSKDRSVSFGNSEASCKKVKLPLTSRQRDNQPKSSASDIRKPPPYAILGPNRS